MEKEILTKIPEGERYVMDVVWENVEKYRKEKGMTVNHLCTRATYSPSNYNKRLEAKGNIVPGTIQRFAWALGVKTLDLFEDWSEQ